MENRKQPQTAYSLLSKYRSELMGFAIMWVVLFHSSIFFSFGPLNFLKTIGYGGVDVFLLISGLGIYRSLQKNTLCQFLCNRLKKILPIWWSFLIISILLRCFLFDIGFSIREILGFATFTGFWLDMDNQGNWYVYAIMLIYLVSPVLAALIRESKNKTAMWLLMILLSTLLSFSFFGHFKLIVFSRIPIYITGMYLAEVGNQIPMKKQDWAVCTILLLAGTALLAFSILYLSDHLWTYGLWWYPFLLIAVPLSLILCRGFSFLDAHLQFPGKVLRLLGAASLEILLTTDYAFSHFSDAVPPGNKGATAVVLMGILTGLLFHYLIEKVSAIFRGRITVRSSQ